MEARVTTVEDFSASDRHLRFLRSTDIPRFPELLVCRHPICRCDRVCINGFEPPVPVRRPATRTTRASQTATP